MGTDVEREIIWTSAMGSLKQKIENNNFCGFYECNLNYEDKEDIISYLSNHVNAPFIELHTGANRIRLLRTDYYTLTPTIIMSLYNTDKAHGSTRKLLKNVISSNMVFEYNNHHEDERFGKAIARSYPNGEEIAKNQEKRRLKEEQENKNRYTIIGYGKKTANALREFSKQYIVLIGDKLPFDIMGEFMSNNNVNGAYGAIKNERMLFLKDKIRLIKNGNEFNFRKNGKPYYFAQLLLAEGKEYVTDKEILEKVGNKGFSSNGRNVEDSVYYTNNSIKEKLLIDFDIFVHDKEKKITCVNPEAKSIINIIDYTK